MYSVNYRISVCTKEPIFYLNINEPLHQPPSSLQIFFHHHLGSFITGHSTVILVIVWENRDQNWYKVETRTVAVPLFILWPDWLYTSFLYGSIILIDNPSTVQTHLLSEIFPFLVKTLVSSSIDGISTKGKYKSRHSSSMEIVESIASKIVDINNRVMAS